MPKELDFLLPGYEVSIATSKEADQILNLLKGVAKRLKEMELEQWGALANGERDDEIRLGVNNKETFIVKKEKEIVATFSLNQTQSAWDRSIWGNLNDDAVYLHRLAIAHAMMGSGLGKEVLQWAETFLKNEGKHTLRLDCLGSNTKLNNFYVINGFEKIGTSNGFTLFQKRL